MIKLEILLTYSKTCPDLALFYTRGFRDSCLTCDDSSLNRFSSCFLTFKFNHTRVLFQMGEGYAAIQWGGLPVVGGGGSLMTRSAGYVTTQRT
jgi:hypothetical protein